MKAKKGRHSKRKRLNNLKPTSLIFLDLIQVFVDVDDATFSMCAGGRFHTSLLLQGARVGDSLPGFRSSLFKALPSFLAASYVT